MAYKKGKHYTNEELLEEMNDDVEYDKKNKCYLFSSYDESTHSVFINFNRLFKRKDVSEYSIFRIHLRKYFKIIPMIVNDLNYILNCDNDSARMYLNFNLKISLAEGEVQEYPEEDFKNDIYEFIDEILDDCKNYVDSTYDLNLDNTNSRINKDLQVTDDMNKKYVTSAVCIRLIIPVMCNYLLYSPENEKKLINQVFSNIIIKVSDGENALNKLKKIVDSRVKVTKYSNQKIWNRKFYMGDDIETTILDFYDNIIEAIIAKMEKDKSSIQFLDGVLKYKLEHLFVSNFPNDYNPLKNLENDDDSDERDRVNEFSFVSNKSEDIYILNVLTIEQIINDFIEKYEVDENDINEFCEAALGDKNVNNIQLFFMKHFYGNKFDFRASTEDNRRKLLMKMVYDLDEIGSFEDLITILTSNLDEDCSQHFRITSKIKNQKAYISLINMYGCMSNFIAKDNFITKALSFSKLLYKNPLTNEYEELSDNVEIQILNFFTLFNKS